MVTQKKEGMKMQVCDQCPKPARCLAREKCFEGRNPSEEIVLAKPEPVRVLTTDGYGMTSEPKKTKKRKAK
jgi:hypothetical protein